MFWNDKSAESGETIWTDKDQDVYTHILYFGVPPEIIASRRENDRDRSRPLISIEHLRKWQHSERRRLRELCRETGILFMVFSEYSILWSEVRHVTYSNVAAHTKLAVLL